MTDRADGKTPAGGDSLPGSHDEQSDDGLPGPRDEQSDDGLLSRIGLIEAQPLADRAAGFEQLHEELLAELQRGDQSG